MEHETLIILDPNLEERRGFDQCSFVPMETMQEARFSKEYDRVNWMYLRLSIIHTGFNLTFINWIGGCLNSSSFSIMMNGFVSHFFKPSRGL
jgi:hypothetical protein